MKKLKNKIRLDYKTKCYTPEPVKGKDYAGNTWISWDVVRMCRQEKCPIFSICKWRKDGRCIAEIKYIRSIFDAIYLTVDKHGDMTQLLLNKVSLHLIPLYHQLIILKIEAYGITDVMLENNKGVKHINPIFKEIRDIISAIEKTQKSMGIDGEYLAMKNVRGRLEDITEGMDAPQDVDPHYYESLLAESKEKIKDDILTKNKHVYEEYKETYVGVSDKEEEFCDDNDIPEDEPQED